MSEVRFDIGEGDLPTRDPQTNGDLERLAATCVRLRERFADQPDTLQLVDEWADLTETRTVLLHDVRAATGKLKGGQLDPTTRKALEAQRVRQIREALDAEKRAQEVWAAIHSSRPTEGSR